jgi:hypothetical protein
MEEEIKAYLTIAKEFKPFMPEIINTILGYGSESKKIIKALIDTGCEMKLRAIKKYTDEGLTKDQAILLVMDSSHTIAEAFKKSF